jgi:hypothetical protein
MADVLFSDISGSGNIDWKVPEVSPNQLWALVSVKLHFYRFSGSGTDTATLTLSVYRERDEKFNAQLYTFAGLGDANDLFFRVHERERDCWAFQAEDQIQFTWTNPDSGNLWYGLEVGYVLHA